MKRRPAHHKLLVWVAQGFGVGWIPLAPGTFGSVLGFGWLALLLAAGDWRVLLVGNLAGIALAVWLCGVAESALGRKDPGSVVLDEVVAIPVCVWAWAWVFFARHDSLPTLAQFFSRTNWPLLVGMFVAFRLFDVLKPWPVRQSQNLPGGWGIVVDDVLAAVYVNVTTLVAWRAGLV